MQTSEVNELISRLTDAERSNAELRAGSELGRRERDTLAAQNLALREALAGLRAEASAGCHPDAPVEELKDGIHFDAVLRADAALALPLPDAAREVEAERAFLAAALAYAEAKRSIEPQAAEYKRTLAALRAAKGAVK
jgi:hypothetical protein